MKWFVAVVLSVAAASCAWGDDCGPPQPGDKLTPPWECCKTGGFELIPEDLTKSMKKCKEKYPLGKPSGEPPKGPPSKEITTALTCAAECLFEEGKLLTADKALDKVAVTKVLTKLFEDNEDWSPVIPKILDKCFASYSAEVDKSLECKSGAKQFEECLMRESFLGCPSNLWSSKAGCEALKTKVTKCPKVPVMLLKPKDD